MLCNTDIRAASKQSGVRIWEIADRLNISEPTITRKLRRELSPDEKQSIFSLIDKIAAEKQEGSDKETLSRETASRPITPRHSTRTEKNAVWGGGAPQTAESGNIEKSYSSYSDYR